MQSLNRYSTIGHIVSTGVPVVGWVACVTLVIIAAPTSLTNVKIDVVDKDAFGYALAVFAITFAVMFFKWASGQCERSIAATKATMKATKDWTTAWREGSLRRQSAGSFTSSSFATSISSDDFARATLPSTGTRAFPPVTAPPQPGRSKDARNVRLWQHIVKSRRGLHLVHADFDTAIKSVESLHSRRLAWPKFVALWLSISALIWLSPLVVFLFSVLSAGSRVFCCKCCRADVFVALKRPEQAWRRPTLLSTRNVYAPTQPSSPLGDSSVLMASAMRQSPRSAPPPPPRSKIYVAQQQTAVVNPLSAVAGGDASARTLQIPMTSVADWHASGGSEVGVVTVNPLSAGDKTPKMQ